MENVKLFVTVYLFSLLCINICLAQADDDACYAAVFTGGAEDCTDFENKQFICSLNIDIASENDDGEGGMILSGDLELKEEITDEFEVELNVWKDIGTGKQYMYTIEGNLCDSLSKNDTPWSPLSEALGTTQCPIAKGIYSVQNLMVSLDFAKSVLNHEFCGDYVVELSFKTLDAQTACYAIGVAVEEESCE